MRSKKIGIALAIIGAVLILIGIVWEVLEILDMLIDHQCYQLEPNDFYNSTICERYWRK